MCFNSKRKRYTYLSMCSCCNIVSKNPSMVKKHLLTSHCKKQLAASREARVIPIRIENRFEKSIMRTLDKTQSKGKTTVNISERGDNLGVKDKCEANMGKNMCNKHKVISNRKCHQRKNRDKTKLGIVRTERGENDIYDCIICHAHLEDCIDYLNHLATEHTDKMFTVGFSCSNCPEKFTSFVEFKNHINQDHNECSAQISVSCMSVIMKKKAASMQCTYCMLQITEIRPLHEHVKNTHAEFMHFDNFEGENILESKANFVMYSCPSCAKQFHTLFDIDRHVRVNCPPSLTSRKPTRKRRPPKWLLDSAETLPTSKKTKTKNKEGNQYSTLIETTVSPKEQMTEEDEPLAKHSEEKKKDIETHVDKAVNVKEGTSVVKLVDVGVVTDMKSKHGNADLGVVVEDHISGDKDLKLEHNDADECELDFGDSDDDFEPEHSDNGTDSDENQSEKFRSSRNKVCSEKQKLHSRTTQKRKFGTRGASCKNRMAFKRSTEAEESASERMVTRYQCPLCDFTLGHNEFMRSHILQSHPEVSKVKIYKREIAKHTLQSEDMEYFKCPESSCGLIFHKKAKLMEHACVKDKFRNKKIMCTLPRNWIEKSEKEVNLICPYCGGVLVGKIKFENHMREHFPDKIFEVHIKDTLPPPELPKCKRIASKVKKALLKDVECALCLFCDFVATQKAQIGKHMKRFHSNESCSNAVLCFISNQSGNKATAELKVRDAGNSVVDISDYKLQGDTKSICEANVTSNETEIITINPLGKDVDLATDTVNITSEPTIVQTVHIQSTVPLNTYLCPLCDFQTLVKKDIKQHIDNHNNKTDDEIDAVYIIPDKWLKQQGEGKFQCQICDSLHGDLTLGFRHVLQSHKEHTVNETNEDFKPLFEVTAVTIEGVKEHYEKQKYRCMSCKPGFIFKSKKGLQLHLKTVHKDEDSQAVFDTVYQMMDLVVDTCDTRFIYVCIECDEGVFTKTELMEHFQDTHPAKYGNLVEKLNNPGGNGGRAQEDTKCGVCRKEFIDTKSLKHHLILHMSKNKHTCDLCEQCFTNIAELEEHNMEVHAKSGDMCYKCGAMFPNKTALARHVKTHDSSPSGSKKVLCQHCGTSVLARNMQKHLVDIHIERVTCNCDICVKQEVPEGKSSRTCDLCNAVCCTWFNLRAHHYRAHNIGKKTVKYTCKICNDTFFDRRRYVRHTHKCRTLTENTNMENFHWSVFEADNTEMTNVVVTEEESVDFSRGLAYVKQKYVTFDKSSEKAYSCKLCSSSFGALKNVYNHLKRMHTRDEAKRYRCKVCKMGFIGKKGFETHCRSHIGLRQYQCTVCQKRYKTLSHLKEHQQIHSSEHRFSCGYCGLEFNQRGAMLAHVVHHDKLKPFKCLFCNKGYTTCGDLQRHMNGYSELKFSGSKKLTHCDYCSKDFQNHNALVRHFQLHLPATPFHCLVCEERFSSFRQMYNHKAKKSHFTESDVELGKSDLEAPGRKFRKYRGQKQNKSRGNIVNTGETEGDNRTVVEINVKSEGQAQTVLQEFESDVIRSMLEIDPEVYNPMDLKSEHPRTNREKQSKEYTDESVGPIRDQYEMPEQNIYHTENAVYEGDNIVVQDFYDVVSEEYLNAEEVPGSVADSQNIVGLADAVAETFQQQQQQLSEPGKTRSFQTADGTFIHVCVVKPDR